MLEHHLIDLDELVLSVRDRSSREYINEAVVSYRARAYRSALIATWIAVAYDIISKIRELDIQGDAEAKKFVADLDAAVALQQTDYGTAVQRLQAIENDLLNQALKKYEFLSPQEHTDLDRLKQDRNLCAHPAFASESLLFQPSPELVRAHITHAITHLLQHPPVQGKSALLRIKRDILEPSFPSTQKDVSEFLESRYLNRAKKTLLTNLVTVCLKTVIKRTDVDLVGKEEEVLRCLAAVKIRYQAVYAERMGAELPTITDGADDAQLKRTMLLFRTDRRCWEWLSQPSRLRLIQMVKGYAYSPADSDTMLTALEIDELRPHLVARVGALDGRDKEELLSRYQRPEFIDEAITLFASAGSFRGAERVEQSIILPMCSMFRVEHVQRVLQAAAENHQIYDAARSPAFFKDMFDRTADLHKETKAAWQAFLKRLVEHNTPHTPDPYPDLRQKMEAAGMWPA
jgi:hypothetical protein